MEGHAALAARPSILHLFGHADQVPGHDAWLGPAEREVCSRLRFAKRRGDWRLGRWTAKRAVRAWLVRHRAGTVHLHRIQVLAAADGAPEAFLDGAPLDLALSLSHSASLAMAAVAPRRTPCGCDVELVEPRSAAFVDDFFTAAEADRVRRGPAQARDVAVTLVWSAKESALKALREGLRLDTRGVEVTWWNDGRLLVRHAPGGTLLRGLWWREGDHVATLVDGGAG